MPFEKILAAGGVTAANASRHVSKKMLAEVPQRIHVDEAGREAGFVAAAWGPDQIVGAAAPALWYGGPAEVTTYFGPVGPSTYWLVQAGQRPSTSPVVQVHSQRVYVSPGKRPEERWFDGPTTFGQRVVSGALSEHPVQPYAFCGGCRDGDVLDLTFSNLLDSAGHFRVDNIPARQGTFRLFQEDGTEIPLQPVRHFLYPTAERATYRLEHRFEELATGRTIGREVSTSWVYESERPPATFRTPPGYDCTFTAPDGPWDPNRTCRHESLIALAYELDLDLFNRGRADRTHSFELTASKHPLADPSAVAGMKVWASTDDGVSWQTAKATRRSSGTYRVSVKHPDLDQTSGFVSLRVQAGDKAGNRVEQTVLRAYALRGGQGGDDDDDNDDDDD